jgi:hypothetical protein
MVTGWIVLIGDCSIQTIFVELPVMGVAIARYGHEMSVENYSGGCGRTLQADWYVTLAFQGLLVRWMRKLGKGWRGAWSLLIE